MTDPLNIAWILLCACLVFLMQAGFLCLETGLMRAKNSINVAVKNIIDLCFAGLAFWMLGYAFMFGESWGGWIGTQGFFFGQDESPWMLSFFVFQAMFCSTSATIVSGAVAERMRFLAYAITALVLVVLIYPVTGHWAWGGLPHGAQDGWLARLGFIDFAGSTVVHSVGGWVSLAAVLRLGPRLGRFDSAGRAMQGSNLPLTTLGVLLLWLGWFGFNGGSTLALNEQVPLILLNTFLAAASGGLTAMAYSYAARGQLIVTEPLNGIIGGLVGITASCHLQEPAFAALIGAISGLLVSLGTAALVRLRIDDAVSAIPAHLFAGIWGTLAVALFAPAGSFELAGGRLAQLEVQALGILAVGGYAFGVSVIALWILDRLYRLRVDAESERLGLNVVEHGASTEILELLTEMDTQRRLGDFSRRVFAEPHTEVGQIAHQYNNVLHRVSEEIHKRESILRDLTASESRKSAILDAVLDCILTIDHAGRILEINPAATRTFGCSSRAALGRPIADLIIPDDARPAFDEALAMGFVTEGRFVVNQRSHTILKRISGETFPAELTIARVRNGQHPEFNFHARDITRQREIQRRLHQLAHYDGLTGLSNRQFFRQNLSVQLMGAAPHGVAVLFLDLDRFKNINDTLGHAAGDQLLRSVAERLRAALRNEDLVARWGGDEFVVALIGARDRESVSLKAAQIIERLAEPHLLEGRSVRAPTSIGAALYPEGGTSADLLIRNADLALYRAKSNGRGHCQLFDPALASEVSERLEFENDLRDALERGELDLFYQPQLEVKSGRLAGLEALLRWRHPDKGMVSPAVFVPILEELGLIDLVGEWVLRSACRQHRLWREQGLRPPRIAVNVSGRQFLRMGFADRVERILSEERTAATDLELEITETVLAHDTAICIETLSRLKRLGLEIALDDFGTGYSSMSYLKRFPIDTLKIDRAFVGECDINAEDAAICTAIFSLARGLGIKTLAEGVETPGQLDFLRREGCTFYQGFLCRKPMPAEETADFIANPLPAGERDL
ncbi:MAG: ammonium transporter [Chromatiaceae bacterium]|nr:ammonium transporter [Chromatiaceae bacterium]